MFILMSFIKQVNLIKNFQNISVRLFRLDNVDYADFFLVSSEDAQEQHDRASELLDAIEKYLNRQ